jgi:hypothetical protein
MIYIITTAYQKLNHKTVGYHSNTQKIEILLKKDLKVTLR